MLPLSSCAPAGCAEYIYAMQDLLNPGTLYFSLWYYTIVKFVAHNVDPFIFTSQLYSVAADIQTMLEDTKLKFEKER